jgi:hypothetical protein
LAGPEKVCFEICNKEEFKSYLLLTFEGGLISQFILFLKKRHLVLVDNFRIGLVRVAYVQELRLAVLVKVNLFKNDNT